MDDHAEKKSKAMQKNRKKHEVQLQIAKKQGDEERVL
jgi:hypothetical protein